MYIWDASKALDDTVLLDLFRKYNILELFVSAYVNQDNQELLQRLNQRTGLVSHAMASTNEFALDHRIALDYIDQIAAFNDWTRDPTRFKGIHFDVEPYTLPAYTNDPTGVLASFVEMAYKCHERSRSFELEFGLSIPFWLK